MCSLEVSIFTLPVKNSSKSNFAAELSFSILRFFKNDYCVTWLTLQIYKEGKIKSFKDSVVEAIDITVVEFK